MKKIFLTILKLMVSIIPISSFATTEQNITPQNDKSNYLFWVILIIIALAIAIYGLYKSHKREITVFANFTDVGFVIASALVPIISLLIMRCLNVSSNIMLTVCFLLFIIFLAVIAKATFLYNKNIPHFILALYTKMFIPVISIVFVIIALLISSSLNRNKYERKTSHSKRQRGTILAGFTSSLLLVMIALHNEKFVTIQDYLSGKD